jgi:hypothetical protein
MNSSGTGSEMQVFSVACLSLSSHLYQIVYDTVAIIIAAF